MLLQLASGLVRRTRAAQRSARAPARTDGVLDLGQVPLGETVELVQLEVPEEALGPLLDHGLLPGCRICPVRRAPSGDPVLLVDGTLIALRRETAACLCVRRLHASHGGR